MSDEAIGVLGKLKAIKDYLDTHLSVTRAAKLDNLTGNVALSSTAMSNAVWTSARLAKLDNLDKALSEARTDMPLKQFMWGCARRLKMEDTTTSHYIDGSGFWDELELEKYGGYTWITAANTWKTVVDITNGSGLFMGAVLPHCNDATVSRTQDLRITIDGTAKTFSDTFTPGSGYPVAAFFLPAVIKADSENKWVFSNSSGSFTSAPSNMIQIVLGNQDIGMLPPRLMKRLRAGKRFTSSLKVEVRSSVRDATIYGDRTAAFYALDNYGGA